MQPFIFCNRMSQNAGIQADCRLLILGGQCLTIVPESTLPGLDRRTLKSYEWWHLGRAQF